MDAGAGLCVDADIAEIRREGRDPVPPVAEPRQIERLGVQRPSAGRPATRELRFVIRETLGDLELQIAVCLDEIQHLRAGPDERLHQLVVHEAERLRAQIVHRVLDRQVTVL